MDELQLKLCDIQGRLFELSGEKGYDSEPFIKEFMTSEVAKGLDSKFNRMQWAGEEYLLAELAESAELVQSGDVYDKEVLYWAGYIYRFWHFYKGENSKEIYKQAPAETMNRNYLIFHTLAPEVAIDDLKEIYKQKTGASIIKQSNYTFQYLKDSIYEYCKSEDNTTNILALALKATNEPSVSVVSKPKDVYIKILNDSREIPPVYALVEFCYKLANNEDYIDILQVLIRCTHNEQRDFYDVFLVKVLDRDEADKLLGDNYLYDGLNIKKEYAEVEGITLKST